MYAFLLAVCCCSCCALLGVQGKRDAWAGLQRAARNSAATLRRASTAGRFQHSSGRCACLRCTKRHAGRQTHVGHVCP